jgi:ABC-type uncharacterized transport system permease subunit
MIGRFDLRRVVPALAASLLAIAFAVLVTSLVLVIVGESPIEAFNLMVENAGRPRVQVLIINLATTYYLSALAVAIGFRMNLFNIGVDGQYRLAAMLAAAVGGAVTLPAPLHVGLILVVAMLVGAMWAGIAAILKVTRGVSEVISTIMLNTIATGLVAWLLNADRLAEPIAGSNNIGTRPIGPSGQVPGLPLIPEAPSQIFGLIILAILCGIAYSILINRTRFGFNLRATGLSESAAVASGVDVKKMVLAAMLLSGAVAGLVGMPQLLGASYTYALDFPAGLGFTGIAIALLGRNNPIGIAIGALLWGFLDASSTVLDLAGISNEIIIIMQGTIVLSVVIAYELVRRYQLAQEQRRVSRELAETVPSGEPEGAPA